MDKKQQRLLAHFYSSLDETTANELTNEQKKSIERALISTGLGSDRKSVV